MKQIHSIVITGGPCSGKSTSMSYLVQKLEAIGYTVIVVPETATEMLLAGCKPQVNIDLYDFEEMLLLQQLKKEELYREIAKRVHGEKVIILFDRGALDTKAYVEEEEWYSILQELHLQEIELRDKPYDAVIHMRTAAFGAEVFYTKENNKARLESPEEARKKCEKTLRSWIGHHHLRVIDNSTDFTTKVKRVLEEVLHVIGEPVPLEIEKKYLVHPAFDLESIPVPYTITDIEQYYFENGDRIRQRGRNGVFVYTKTRKQETEDPDVRVEYEEMITSREYHSLLKKLRETTKSFSGFIGGLEKTRVCFVYKEQYFELDFIPDIDAPVKYCVLLEIELTDKNKEISLPPWLPIIREVTNEKPFRNIELARTFT